MSEAIIGLMVIIIFVGEMYLFYGAMTANKQEYAKWAVPAAFIGILFLPLALVIWGVLICRAIYLSNQR